MWPNVIDSGEANVFENVSGTAQGSWKGVLVTLPIDSFTVFSSNYFASKIILDIAVKYIMLACWLTSASNIFHQKLQYAAYKNVKISLVISIELKIQYISFLLFILWISSNYLNLYFPPDSVTNGCLLPVLEKQEILYNFLIAINTIKSWSPKF